MQFGQVRDQRYGGVTLASGQPRHGSQEISIGQMGQGLGGSCSCLLRRAISGSRKPSPFAVFCEGRARRPPHFRIAQAISGPFRGSSLVPGRPPHRRPAVMTMSRGCRYDCPLVPSEEKIGFMNLPPTVGAGRRRRYRRRGADSSPARHRHSRGQGGLPEEPGSVHGLAGTARAGIPVELRLRPEVAEEAVHLLVTRRPTWAGSVESRRLQVMTQTRRARPSDRHPRGRIASSSLM